MKFLNAIDRVQERDEYRVLCWYGVGGQGKSTLLQVKRDRALSRPNIALAELDFNLARHRRLEDAMLKIRGDLAKYGISFPTFDFAYSRNFALEYPGRDIREVHPELYRKGESQLVDEMIDWSETAIDAAVSGVALAVPGLNLLYKYGSRLTGRLADWWASRAVKEKLLGFDKLSQSQIAARLPQFLGFDIWRACADAKCPRIVITFDTHEKLNGGSLRGDEWLRSFVREAPGALILILGREKLRWDNFDEGWSDVLDQESLEALSDEDANRFLELVPMPEADIRNRIVEASVGLPHYLDLAVSTYEDIKNSGRSPTLGDFGTTPVSVRERFLDHLTEIEKRDLFLASYPESLSERLFSDLSDALVGGAANVNWPQLKRRSFMVKGEDKRLFMHSLMRDALQEFDRIERPNLFSRTHQFLFKRYGSLVTNPDSIVPTPDSERAFVAASFHAKHLEPNEIFGWLKTTSEPFRKAARWRTLEIVFENALEAVKEESCDRPWFLHELGRVQMALGQYSEAETLYRQSLGLKELSERKDDPEYARTMHELARARSNMGHYSDAEALYEEALALKRVSLGEHDPSFANSLHELARVRMIMGRNSEAKDLYERALQIKRTALGNNHISIANTLHELARINFGLARHGEAQSLYEQSLTIKREQIGEEHPSYAITLHELARLQLEVGNLSKANEIYERSLAIKAAVLGESHPSYANTLHEIGRICMTRGQYSKAMRIYKDTLEIKRAALGDGHSSFAATLHEIARAYKSLDHYPEAEAIYEQTRSIKESAVGKNNRSYAITLHELASVRADMGYNTEAEALFAEALSIKKAVAGEDSPSYAVTLHELAQRRIAAGQLTDAEQFFEQAFSILSAALGDANPRTIRYLGSLAACRAALGKIPQGRRLLELAYERASNLQDNQELITAELRFEWARQLAVTSARGEAKREALAALNSFEGLLSPGAKLVREAQELVSSLVVG